MSVSNVFGYLPHIWFDHIESSFGRWVEDSPTSCCCRGAVNCLLYLHPRYPPSFSAPPAWGSNPLNACDLVDLLPIQGQRGLLAGERPNVKTLERINVQGFSSQLVVQLFEPATDITVRQKLWRHSRPKCQALDKPEVDFLAACLECR